MYDVCFSRSNTILTVYLDQEDRLSFSLFISKQLMLYFVFGVFDGHGGTVFDSVLSVPSR